MKATGIILILVTAILLMSAQVMRRPEANFTAIALNEVKKNSLAFSASAAELQQAFTKLDAGDPSSKNRAIEALKDTRYKYKKIAYFMEYFFKSAAHVYNAPAKVEVEEPELEYEEPVGFQLMETLLFQDITPQTRRQLLEQAEVIKTSADDIPSLFYRFDADDAQVMESIRQELIRIELLYITGYDAPLLKSGIAESAAALSAIKTVLARQKDAKIDRLLKAAINYLNAHPDFNNFDRLHFITAYISPLQRSIGTDLFDRNFLKMDLFDPNRSFSSPALTMLGKKLFFEKTISGNGQRSCASCHRPEKYFTDNLPKSTTLDGHGTVSRNAPTLLYAAYQFSQDWDGRARSIEEQVLNVMRNKDEMAADSAEVITSLKHHKSYPTLFRTAFRNGKITLENLSIAVAAYVRTLAPFNSPFDRYMKGDHQALDPDQIRGFNLFMGKAQCGTCHFAPIFNGLIPPDFKRTEFEILGVPNSDDLEHARPDGDQGRYNIWRSRYYMGAFKTPTVRNVSKTAPYMHNGSFRKLSAVIQFYNKGGGKGIGLAVPEQTLSTDELKLSNEEINSIVAFVKSLKDRQ